MSTLLFNNSVTAVSLLRYPATSSAYSSWTAGAEDLSYHFARQCLGLPAFSVDCCRDRQIQDCRGCRLVGLVWWSGVDLLWAFFRCFCL